MANRNERLREALSDLEHRQWEQWSMTLGKELHNVKSFIQQGQTNLAIQTIVSRLERWKANWKPYPKLTETVKNYDRKWADKVIAIINSIND